MTRVISEALEYSIEYIAYSKGLILVPKQFAETTDVWLVVGENVVVWYHHDLTLFDL